MMPLAGPFGKKRPDAARITRLLKDVVRAHFRLGEEDVILITEVECQTPGCPPLETVIAFWCEDQKRRQLKVFKPLADVSEDDLPPWWMKSALIHDDYAECSCC
jgi:nitrate reductase delta subunit